jgi:drug/metabolite transporter (DMT)-like permease
VPYLRLLGAQLAIGAAAIFARFALGGTGPFAASALRLAIAAIPVAVLAVSARPRARLGLRREAAFAIAGAALAIHFAAWLASLLYTSVAISTLLVCTSPIWTALYDAFVLRARVGKALVAAIPLAAAGLLLVTTQRSAPAPVPGRALEGDLLALLGSLAIGVYLLIVRSAGARPASGAPVSTRQIVARTYAWAALVLTLVAFATHEGPPAPSDTSAWLGILAMALISQLLGHTSLNAALRDFAPSTVAMSTLLEPVFAAALAAAIFHETLSLAAALGGVLILAAILLALRGDVASAMPDAA